MTTLRKRALWAGAVVLAAIGVIGVRLLLGGSELPDGLIQANGRIEGDHVTVASKFPGRIAQIMVREGDTVRAGQILASLDDAQITARVDQAAAAVATLDAQIAAATTALAVLRRELPLAVSGASAGLARANADIAKADAAHLQDARDAERARDLRAKGLVPQQNAERAELAATAAQAAHDSARSGVVEAQNRLSQAQLGADRIAAKEAELVAMKAQREQAVAGLAEARSVVTDLTLKAPSPGVVLTRFRQAGEVVSAGSPILDLVDLDQLYLKVYVPEVQLGKLRLNLPARIYTDAFPETPFEATVTYISSRAEFTPKEVQTPDERVKLTYAVKLTLTSNPEHRLTPGLPADAVIRWQDSAEWVKPKW